MSKADAEMLRRATVPAADGGAPGALLVFAHPDDETIALGGRLAWLRDACLVHVTDGAPLNGPDRQANGFAGAQQYQVARRQELACALAIAGCAGMAQVELGFGDQCAAHELVSLTLRLAEVLHTRRPEVVFTHPYEGGHPDHDACAFAVAAAVELAWDEPAPSILEAAFYHLGPQGIETGCFLGLGDGQSQELVYTLDATVQAAKRRMLACFRTQQQTLAYFGVERELYRVAPRYDFTRPPHAGRTFYDGFDWGMRSAEFCRLAREARRQLGLIPRAEAP